jgi:glucose-1-phosphatase
MIHAVIFDFGNVICRFDPTMFVRAVAPYSSKSIPELGNILMNSSDLFVEYETGRIPSAVFLELMSIRCSLSCTQAQFIEAFNSIFSPNLPTFDLIRRLKPNYRLGLLSNTSEWHFRHGIYPTEVFPLFETVTLSFEVGTMKPAEDIYRDALEKLGLPPENCVYIDDIKEYADAATALGMHGIHYADHHGLLTHLAALGISAY